MTEATATPNQALEAPVLDGSGSPLVAGVRAARWATGTYFFVFGVLVCSFAPHIPFVEARLDVSPGWFGLALLSAGLGGIVAMPTCGYLIGRFGSAPVIAWAAPLTAVSLPLLALAPTYWTFVAALALFGALLGMTDVAMNSHGVAVEQRLGRATMSTFHGLFSVAGLLTAGVAALLIERISEPSRMLLSTLFCVAATVVATRFLLPASVDQGASERKLVLPTRATLLLGLLALLALMAEGAIMDWGGIYLRDTHGADPSLISLMVGAYFGCMAVSRLTGDVLRTRFGSARVLRHGAWLTALFMGLALVSPTAPLALAGLALSGLTLGPLVPILYAAGGNADPDNPGQGVAAVGTLAYTGLIFGPPLVGLFAQVASLTFALAVIAALCLVVAAFGASARVADGHGD
jgi:fucose permease